VRDARASVRDARRAVEPRRDLENPSDSAGGIRGIRVALTIAMPDLAPRRSIFCGLPETFDEWVSIWGGVTSLYSWGPGCNISGRGVGC